MTTNPTDIAHLVAPLVWSANRNGEYTAPTMGGVQFAANIANTHLPSHQMNHATRVLAAMPMMAEVVISVGAVLGVAAAVVIIAAFEWLVGVV